MKSTLILAGPVFGFGSWYTTSTRQMVRQSNKNELIWQRHRELSTLGIAINPMILTAMSIVALRKHTRDHSHRYALILIELVICESAWITKTKKNETKNAHTAQRTNCRKISKWVISLNEAEHCKNIEKCEATSCVLTSWPIKMLVRHCVPYLRSMLM